MSKNFQKLTDAQIEHLKRNNCSADNWTEIEVTEDFNPEWVNNVQFSGRIRMGCFQTSTHQLGG